MISFSDLLTKLSRSSVMVRTSAWHADVRSPDQACYILRVKNLAINIRDCVSIVGHGGSVVGASLRTLDKFVYSTLLVSFG